ncbi:hypothetical protein BU16DRAFT_591336, partial [Lophium mytilinum]
LVCLVLLALLLIFLAFDPGAVGVFRLGLLRLPVRSTLRGWRSPLLTVFRFVPAGEPGPESLRSLSLSSDGNGGGFFLIGGFLRVWGLLAQAAAIQLTPQVSEAIVLVRIVVLMAHLHAASGRVNLETLSAQLAILEGNFTPSPMESVVASLSEFFLADGAVEHVSLKQNG